MIEFGRILCPVDFSESSNRSLTHATALARWYDAKLTVLHVVPTLAAFPTHDGFGVTVPIVGSVSPEEVVEDMRRRIDPAALPAGAAMAARVGDPSTAIVEQAATGQADVIVMGTHGRRGFKRLLLGSVTETVLREAPCPVLTVPPGADPGRSDVAFKRILCPMDFSAEALQALEFALDLARQSDGTVTLLHVLEWLAEDGPRVSAGIDLTQLRRSLIEEAEHQMRALVDEESQTWCEIEHLLSFGRAYREILRIAHEKGTDLIVMGAQGRGGVDLALFGSTTQQVVRGASCPVLTVRSRGNSGQPS